MLGEMQRWCAEHDEAMRADTQSHRSSPVAIIRRPLCCAAPGASGLSGARCALTIRARRAEAPLPRAPAVGTRLPSAHRAWRIDYPCRIIPNGQPPGKDLRPLPVGRPARDTERAGVFRVAIRRLSDVTCAGVGFPRGRRSTPTGRDFWPCAAEARSGSHHGTRQHDYVSTACRIGNHEECQTLRIVPNCPCPCHLLEEEERNS
jgi:hypothetical protein